jgi:hypothetical protein
VTAWTKRSKTSGEFMAVKKAAAHGVPNSVLLDKPFAPAQLVIAVAQLLNRF